MLSGLTDLADGYIARRFHRISNLGKILDPVADKPTQTAMLICLFTRFPHMLLLIVIMAGKELYMVIITYQLQDRRNDRSEILSHKRSENLAMHILLGENLGLL